MPVKRGGMGILGIEHFFFPTTTSVTLVVLRNMQNYYETFCRINPEVTDDEFRNMSDEEDGVSPFDYIDEQLIDHNSYLVDQNASNAMETTLLFEPFTDEFVTGLQNSPPIRLSTQSGVADIPYVDAIAAGNKLSTNQQTEAFQLPGAVFRTLLESQS